MMGRGKREGENRPGIQDYVVIIEFLLKTMGMCPFQMMCIYPTRGGNEGEFLKRRWMPVNLKGVFHWLAGFALYSTFRSEKSALLTAELSSIE